MKTIILVDGNNIGYAAQNAGALSYEGKPVQSIFHSLKMLKTALRGYAEEGYKVIVLWDGHAKWRFDIHPEYKSNRGKDEKSKQMKEDFKSQQPAIVKALNILGVDQILGKTYEADDLAGFLSKGYVEKGYNVVLMSGDKDWIQLVNSRVTWQDPIRDRFVKRSNFAEFTGVGTSDQYVEIKALEGDKSDAIDGVPGIGEKSSLLIMEEYGSVQGLFDAFDALEGDEFTKETLPASLSRYRKKINDFCSSGRELFERNVKLMDLRDVPVNRDDMKVVRGDQDFEKFRTFCGDYAFQSIIRELRAWEAIFGANT